MLRLALIFLALSVPTLAQEVRASISGNITDPSGQPLEGVYVANYTPSNNPNHGSSGSFRGTWTDSAGNYTLTGIGGGSYTITPTLYPLTFAVSGFANPVTVGPNSTGKNFTSTSLPHQAATSLQVALLASAVALAVGAAPALARRVSSENNFASR